MFKLKYLKYKKKYLNLKVGGMNAPNDLHNANLEVEFEGKTPLINAIINNKYFLAKDLIENGANLEAKFEGKTPLIIAAKNNKYFFVKDLIDKGANLEAKFEGKTPLIIAIQNNNFPIAEELIQKNANIEAKFEGKTPLIIAIENDRYLIAKNLIEKGANIEAKFEGKTPLIIAIIKNKFSFAEKLIEKGADPNVIDLDSGDSALFIAVKKKKKIVNNLKNLKLINLLLNNRANIFFRNNDNLKNQGKTIFEYIIDNNIQQIIELESFRRIQALNSIADQYRIPDETVWEILGYGKLDD